MKVNVGKSGLWVLFITFVLTIIGIYMVYSASKEWAFFKFGDATYYVKRQAIFVSIGFVLMYLTIRFPVNEWEKYTKTILITSLVLLVLVLIPGVGIVRNGSQSWFGIGSFAIQPAELFKFSIVLFASQKLASNYKETKYFFRGTIPVLIPTVIGFLLIMLQPDLGTGVVMIASIVVMTMVSRTKIRNYFYLGGLALLGLIGLIIAAPYRMSRITAFINPWQDPLGSGFQIIQSLYAIGPGGILGLGIDGSIQKHFFLPEPQTDFIFAILAEEFGLIGGLFVIFLFVQLLTYGVQIARSQSSLYRAFLASGITAMLGIQIAINLGVVVGLLPVTGITLPFISYGGSSLIISIVLAGLLAACDQKQGNP